MSDNFEERAVQILKQITCLRASILQIFFGRVYGLDISKKTQGQKTQAGKKLEHIFKKNSSKSFKNSIICQLKTDFLLKKVLKLIHFAQKFPKLKF